jgi:hypothetical protein
MTSRQRDAGQAQGDLALLAMAAKNSRAAIGYASNAIDRLNVVVAKMPQDGDARRHLANAHLTLADALASTGDSGRAATHRTLAIEALEPLSTDLAERRFQYEWARALRSVGRNEDSAKVIARLRATGFRRDALDALAPNER